ncbi:hypothetical protein [uncultured Clostridium sp.]|uniref:hypothetical protein n=1 Tax=uncultured Clostridium sp. TaxID=59620 RepID=UPI0026255436|nr:hypothetical protein [uncultured Clostridium sp.]
MFSKKSTEKNELERITNLFKYFKFLLYAVDEKYPISDENDLTEKSILKQTIENWILDLQDTTQKFLNQTLTLDETNENIKTLLTNLESLKRKNAIFTSIIDVYNCSRGSNVNSGLPNFNMNPSHLQKGFNIVREAFKKD